MATEHPGCFGLPTAISANSASCRRCPVQGSCLFEAAALLDTLPRNPLTQRERLALALTRRALAGPPQRGGGGNPATPVATSRCGIQRSVLSPTQDASFDTLSAPLAKQARELAQRGWFDFARSELHAGRNPAIKGWRRVFCDLLLAGGGPRAALVQALAERLNLTPESARVQASRGLVLFAAGRIATEQGGHFALLPNNALHTTY